MIATAPIDSVRPTRHRTRARRTYSIVNTLDLFARWRDESARSRALAVLYGRDAEIVRAVLIAWPTIDVRWSEPKAPKKAPVGHARYYQWLCGGCSVDPEDWHTLGELCAVAGLEPCDAAYGLRKALAQRLALPDGTLSDVAIRYLEECEVAVFRELA